MQQADRPQSHNETDRAPHPDGWVIPHYVLAIILQCRVRHRDRQRDGRHVAHHVDQHHPEKGGGILDQRYREQHRGSGQMQQAVELFGIDPFVGNHTGDGRHEQRGDTHRREDRAELRA